MSWRPKENWPNPYYDGAARYAVNSGGVDALGYDQNEFNRLKREGTAYEAGADALLGCLLENKELSRIIVNDKGFTLTFPDGLEWARGTWVFIEDEMP